MPSHDGSPCARLPGPAIVRAITIGACGSGVVKKRVKTCQSRLKMDVTAPDEGQYRFGSFLLNPAHRSLARAAAYVTIFAPILTSFSRRLVSDQCLTVSGNASVRMKLARL